MLRFSVRQSLLVARTARANYHVGIIGCGSVGASCASALVHLPGLVQAISLFDVNSALAEGEAMDLEDEAYFTGTAMCHVKSLEQLRDCDVVVFTAGARQTAGQTRTHLLHANAIILKDILQKLMPFNSKGSLVLVTNPVDILTSLAQEWTKEYLPKSQVIGTGTYLDTQRLRVRLSQQLGMSAHCIHAYVLGEHGDSQVVPRSIIKIGGCDISQYDISPQDLSRIEEDTKNKAYKIISLKGCPNHGIGEAVANICESILSNKKNVMPVSAFVPDLNATIGWPSVVGKGGAEITLPVALTVDEREHLKRSAESVRSQTERLMKQLTIEMSSKN